MSKCISDFAKIAMAFNNSFNAEISVSEIAYDTQLPSSKVSRMLSALEKEGFLERNLGNGKYRIGMFFFEIGHLYALHHPLRNIVRPHIEEMARDLPGYCSWAVMDRGKVLVMDRIRNPEIHHLRLCRFGLKIPIHSTCTGKVFLAYMSEPDQDEFFRHYPDLVKFCEKTTVDPKKLKESFKVIKKRGYATANGETVPEISCIAAPIFNSFGSVVAVTNFAYLTEDCTDELFDRAVNYMTEKANFISIQLGFEQFNATLRRIGTRTII